MAWPKFTIGVYREVPQILTPKLIYIYYHLNVTGLHTIWSKLSHHFRDENQKGDTAMFESNVHDWASLAIPQMRLKKAKYAQMCPGVTKAKTAAAMFSGHKWMSLCATT